MLRYFYGAAVALLSTGCGSSEPTPGMPFAETSVDGAAASDASAENVDGDAARADAIATISFARDVQPILDRHCVMCHGDASATLDLRAGRAFESLTTKRAALCELPLVTAGRLEESALWIKIIQPLSEELRCGREMPALGKGALRVIDPKAAETIGLWIAQPTFVP